MSHKKIDPRTLPDIRKSSDLTGYMKDAKGALIPSNMVKPIDKKRDEIVRSIFVGADVLSNQMRDAKAAWVSEIEQFVEKTAKSYDVKLGGTKGNLTLMSFDGAFKVQIAVAERIVFDERLQIAKKQIDECMKRWTKDSRSEIRVLINSAFDVDKQGNVNRERILGLRRLDIKDEQWKKAMNIISDSIQVASTKSYIRVYRRDESGEYKQVPLDFASL